MVINRNHQSHGKTNRPLFTPLKWVFASSTRYQKGGFFFEFPDLIIKLMDGQNGRVTQYVETDYKLMFKILIPGISSKLTLFEDRGKFKLNLFTIYKKQVSENKLTSSASMAKVLSTVVHRQFISRKIHVLIAWIRTITTRL